MIVILGMVACLGSTEFLNSLTGTSAARQAEAQAQQMAAQARYAEAQRELAEAQAQVSVAEGERAVLEAAADTVTTNAQLVQWYAIRGEVRALVIGWGIAALLAGSGVIALLIVIIQQQRKARGTK